MDLGVCVRLWRRVALRNAWLLLDNTTVIALAMYPGMMVLYATVSTASAHEALQYVKNFILGIVAVIIAGFLELKLLTAADSDKMSLLEGTSVFALIVAIVEESLKIPAACYGKRPIPSGVSFAAGFASAENVLYCMLYGRTTAVTRAALSVPVHCITAGILGSGVKRFKLKGQIAAPWIAFLIAVSMHFAFDALPVVDNPGVLFTVLSIIVIIGAIVVLSESKDVNDLEVASDQTVSPEV